MTFREIFERFDKLRQKQLAEYLERKRKRCRHPSKKYNTRRRRRMVRERAARYDYWIVLLSDYVNPKIRDIPVKNPELLKNVAKKYVVATV